MPDLRKATLEISGQRITICPNFGKVVLRVEDRDGAGSDCDMDPTTARELSRIIDLEAVCAEGDRDDP